MLPEPPGGHAPLDPTAGLSAAQVARAKSFAALLRPASLFSLALGLAVAGVLGLTPLGRPDRAGRRAAPLGGGWVWQVLLGVLALAVIGRLVTLPLSAYGEVVRHRYGLSTRSWGLWLRDVAVATAINAGLTALGPAGPGLARPPRAADLVGLGRRRGRRRSSSSGPSSGRCSSSRRSTGSSRCRPGRCAAICWRWREENGTPVQDVLVSDASRRTTALNAYVSGFGSTRRIVVYDTVLEQLPDDQIESIAAHELGHVAADDVLTGTLIGALGAAAGVAAARLAAVARPGCAGGRARTRPAIRGSSRSSSS